MKTLSRLRAAYRWSLASILGGGGQTLPSSGTRSQHSAIAAAPQAELPRRCTHDFYGAIYFLYGISCDQPELDLLYSTPEFDRKHWMVCSRRIRYTLGMMNTLQSDEARWDAVQNRDQGADGGFLYAVRTTGVYCRPSCGSRQALRQNVEFFNSAMEAETAGYRPCKRCKPNEPALAEEYTKLVQAACRTMEEAEEIPSLETLARAAGKSPFHFHRIFKSLTGVTPKAYADANRAQKMRAELPKSASVSDAIYDAGFNSFGSFYKGSSDLLGMTPKTFRKGGVGSKIRFAVGECWLGSILVASTDKGICAILLGDNPDALVRDLQDRFRQAELIGADKEYEQTVAKVVGFIEAPARGLDLPLDVLGTAFQQRVWHALRQIKPGSTATYSEVAESIGRPTASRAVATACASNPVAVAIPCHRVVRTDGTLSGYRWGVERKRALIDREATQG